jgi:peptidoglycan/xylan/chitin deacetylase (PgdA/CDA1 family)
MSKAAIANLLVRVHAFAPFRFLNRSKLPVLMYHRFSEGEEFGKTSRRTFEKHLRYLTRHYKVLPLSEAVTCIHEGVELPNRSAVITVDDGYRDFFDVGFPVLRDFRVPATIYVVTEFTTGDCWIWTDRARYILSKTAETRLDFRINGKAFNAALGDAGSRLSVAGSVNTELKKMSDADKDLCLTELSNVLKVSVPSAPPDEFSALTWDHARKLSADRIEIGSHTRTHPILTNVDSARLEVELQESMIAIQHKLQQDTIHFCYPNGNVSQRERDAAEAAGYASAVTTEIKLCENGSDPFLIPRIDAEPELHRFVQATSGFDEVKGGRWW